MGQSDTAICPAFPTQRAGVAPVQGKFRLNLRAQLGLEALTLYAFSVENWKRPQAAEVENSGGSAARYT